MAEILLLNPRRRRKKARRMSALQRKYFGKRAKRASNPRRRRRRRVVASTAPVIRRRRRIARRMANPRKRRAIGYTVGRRRIRRRRLNPSLRRGFGSIPQTSIALLKSGGVGALGALGLDVAYGQLQRVLPATIATSPLAQYVVKLLAAIGVGWLGDKVLRGRGKDLAVGGVTVVLHDAFKAQLQASFPALQLGEYLSYAPAVGTIERAGRLMDTGMAGVGEYLSGLPQEVGYPNDNSGFYGNGNGDFSGDGLSG